MFLVLLTVRGVRIAMIAMVKRAISIGYTGMIEYSKARKLATPFSRGWKTPPMAWLNDWISPPSPQVPGRPRVPPMDDIAPGAGPPGTPPGLGHGDEWLRRRRPNRWAGSDTRSGVRPGAADSSEWRPVALGRPSSEMGMGLRPRREMPPAPRLPG